MQAVVGLVAKPGKTAGIQAGQFAGMEGLAEIKISSAAVVEIPKNPEPAQENETYSFIGTYRQIYCRAAGEN